MNLLENKRIAIIGGGPGGLTLARLLQLNGAEVKVYERDYSKDARVQGAIVDLHYDSGLKVIEAAGLLDAFKVNYMPGADKYRLLNKDATIVYDEHQQGHTFNFGDVRFRPEIDRGALRNILLAALLPDTVVWDSHFKGMLKVADQWEIDFTNGTKAVADLVIGSDGYRSKIRPYVTDLKALYSGATIIQGEIAHPAIDCPEIYHLVNNANLMAMDAGKTLAVQPRGDGGITFYIASLYPENWESTSPIDFKNKDAVNTYLVDYFAGWNTLYFELFKASSHFTVRPLNYFPIDQKWDSNLSVTLIGDAAHLMPPSGEGVNTAMLDALDLSEHLYSSSFPDLQGAIAAFEKKMLSRSAEHAKEAVEGIKDFAAPSDIYVKNLIQLLGQ